MKALFAIALVAACGSNKTPTPDAPGNSAGTVTVSGIASQQTQSGGTPVAGVMISAYTNAAPTAALGTAMSDASGAYSLTLTTNGVPIDGFLKATKAGNVDTYLFPPAPISADMTNAAINEIDTGTYSLLSSIGSQHSGQSMIVLEVDDAAGAPVPGVAVSSTPAAGKVGYSGSSGIPDTNATGTADDGLAYLFGVAPGTVTLSATKTGVTFKSHPVTAVADAFVTTLITE